MRQIFTKRKLAAAAVLLAAASCYSQYGDAGYGGTLTPYIEGPSQWLSGSSGTNATARIGADERDWYLDLDTDLDYVSTGISSITGDFSIIAICKSSDVTDTQNQILGNAGNGVRLARSNFEYRDYPNYDETLTHSTTLQNDTWYDLRAERTGTNLALSVSELGSAPNWENFATQAGPISGGIRVHSSNVTRNGNLSASYIKLSQASNDDFIYDFTDVSGSNVPDTSGNGNDGTITGSPVHDFTGADYSADGSYVGANTKTFNGVDEWLQYPASCRFEDGDTIDIECVFKRTSTLPTDGTDQSTLYYQGNWAGEHGGIVQFALRGGSSYKGFYFRVWDGSVYRHVSPSTDLTSAINDGGFHTYRVTFDGSTARIYFDGNEVGSADFSAYNIELTTVSSYYGLMVDRDVPSVGGTLSYLKSEANDSIRFEYAFASGPSETEYDISGNGNHGTYTTTNAAQMATTDSSGTAVPWNVVNGFGQLQLCANNDFDTQSSWTPQASWSIDSTNSVAVCNSTNGTSRHIYHGLPSAFVDGDYYLVTIEITDYISGSVQVNTGGYSASIFKSGNGVYAFVHQVDSGIYTPNANFYISAHNSTGFRGSIDSIRLVKCDSNGVPLVSVPSLADGSADALGNPLTNPGGFVHNGAEPSLVWANGTNTLAELQALNGVTNLPIKNVYYFDSAPSALFTNTIINIAPWNGVWEVAP